MKESLKRCKKIAKNQGFGKKFEERYRKCKKKSIGQGFGTQ